MHDKEQFRDHQIWNHPLNYLAVAKFGRMDIMAVSKK